MAPTPQLPSVRITGPPGSPKGQPDPGGFQARADGQQIEVRTFEGELVRVVSAPIADELVRNSIADDLGHGLRLKLGIRWLPTRLDRPSGRPDLNEMLRRQPNRYATLWRGSRNPRVGKGALGRALVDTNVRLAAT